MQLEEGQELGRYTLVRRLGQGGAGEVWRALMAGPMGFEKPVAVKLVRSDRRVAGLEDDLVREARFGALMAHPNVVATYELGSVGGRRFIAMEYVEGPALKDLAGRGGLPGRALLDVGEQAALGLAHIHELRAPGAPQGLVHRDIKPGNLLVDRTGVVKVADLGIARLAARADLEVGISGTPGYMPPEQADGAEDPRSDLFALGVTLFRLSGAAPPFGKGLAAIAQSLAVEQLMARRGFFDHVEERVPGLSAVLRDCLRLDPDDRFGSARELAVALRALRGGVAGTGDLVQLVGLPATLEAEEETVTPSVPTRSRAARTGAEALIGRALELARLVDGVRRGPGWWTVIGPGGVGKTRLVVELARDADLPGGHRFVELQAAGSRSDVLTAMARALRVVLQGADPEGQIGNALAGLGRALVVLDNVEHLVQHADLFARWASEAPELSVVATSRRSLAVSGTDIVLEPLPPPDAIALFRARVPRALSRRELATVGQIVARLDGLPLAVELAAARMQRLSPADILAGLESRMRLSGMDGRPGLWHSFELSWDLLTPWERAALAQFSVFAGGATLRAATALIDVAAWPEAPWPADVLDALRHHSLLGWDARSQRYTMLQTVQEFSRSKLDDSALYARHATWYAQLGTGEMVARRRRDPDLALAYRADLANLLLAHDRSCEAGEPVRARYTALAILEVLRDVGPVEEAARRLEATLELEEHPDTLLALGQCRWILRQTDSAVELQERALGLARSSGDTELVVRSLRHLARALFEARRMDAAREVLAELEQAATRAGLEDDLIAGAYVEGLLAKWAGDRGRARALMERCIAHYHRVGDLFQEVKARTQLGVALWAEGRLVDAEEQHLVCLRLARLVQDDGENAVAAMALGGIDLELARFERAEAMYARAERIFRRVGNRGMQHGCLVGLAMAQAYLGRPAEASAHLETARELVPPTAKTSHAMGALGHGILAILAGDPTAREHTQRSLDLFEEGGLHRYFVPWTYHVGALALAGDLEGTRAALETTFEACGQNARWKAIASAGGAWGLVRAGRVREARTWLADARALCDAVVDPGLERVMVGWVARDLRGS
ncbi:MAG: protein kinase [Alphaproteobacteria bacterium]|nr:protein kinase [Alphaproteobacteria bacterium]